MAKADDHAEGKGEARSDETQAVVHCLHRKFVEALACLLRRLAKQPLDAEAQSRKSKDEYQDGPPTWDLRPEKADGPLELVRQIGERGGEAPQCALGSRGFGYRSNSTPNSSGLSCAGAAAAGRPCFSIHFWTVGSASNVNSKRFLGSASNAVSSAICGGVAVSWLDPLGDAALAPDSTHGRQ